MYTYIYTFTFLDDYPHRPSSRLVCEPPRFPAMYADVIARMVTAFSARGDPIGGRMSDKRRGMGETHAFSPLSASVIDEPWPWRPLSQSDRQSRHAAQRTRSSGSCGSCVPSSETRRIELGEEYGQKGRRGRAPSSRHALARRVGASRRVALATPLAEGYRCLPACLPARVTDRAGAVVKRLKRRARARLGCAPSSIIRADGPTWRNLFDFCVPLLKREKERERELCIVRYLER